MSQIEIANTDHSVDSLVRSATTQDHAPTEYTPYFTANEELYLELPQAFEVPSFTIHHDVREELPSAAYRKDLHTFLQQLLDIIPDVFHGLRYFFDPADILRPGFFRLYRIEDSLYLYLLRLDLLARPGMHTTLDRGSNERTHAYRSTKLFVEADIIPIRELKGADDHPEACVIQRSISETWIGETGRGYYVQGIWLDRELTKFFSKLFLPDGARTYPYYPITCKYQAVCHSIYRMSADDRDTGAVRAHQARTFLDPHMETIQNELRSKEFSPDLEIFRTLRAQAPPELTNAWATVQLKPFLNERDMKEFRIEE